MTLTPALFTKVGRLLLRFAIYGFIAAALLMLTPARGLVFRGGADTAAAQAPTPAPAHQ